MPLLFDDRFVRELPNDPLLVNVSRQVHGAALTRVEPTTVKAPRLVAYSREVADSLGLTSADFEQKELVEALGGNRLLPGMKPYAACYGGHQFGHWAGQLGDGRAMTLGEVRTPNDERLELQLKGAGRTPYSRGADGRAVLRSSVREFLCSEAMHHLGVPTTRALSLVLTGDGVVRDMLYNGNPEVEPGAIVARVAPSFVRFGNFELPTSRKDHKLLRTLADFTIRSYFPAIAPLLETENRFGEAYTALVAEVARRTATMCVHWMRVGFVHGVMNTDNMSVLGLTIDYGPYGWLEPYDPGWTPNTTDAGGRRYAYGRQPAIAAWNVACLAEALAPLISSPADLAEALREYDRTFDEAYTTTLSQKLGIQELRSDGAGGDAELVTDLFKLLPTAEIDMTIFFRGLSSIRLVDEATVGLEAVADAFYDSGDLSGETGARMLSWLRRWAERVREDGRPDQDRITAMQAINPLYVLRNWLAQEAIDKAAAGDFTGVTTLLDVLRQPYSEQPGREHFSSKRPEWARHRVGCSMLSCSS